MGLIDDILSEEAKYFFDADLISGVESITYTPFGGAAVTRTAQVHRMGMSNESGITVFVLRIEIENNAARGILSSTMKVGGDTVTLKPRPSGTSRTYQLPTPDPDSDLQVLRFTLEGKGM